MSESAEVPQPVDLSEPAEVADSPEVSDPAELRDPSQLPDPTEVSWPRQVLLHARHLSQCFAALSFSVTYIFSSVLNRVCLQLT